MTISQSTRGLALLALLGGAACAPAAGPAPVVAAPATADTAARAADTTFRAAESYTAADVRFMSHMIHHHAQALQMAALVPSRAQSAAVKRLAERITVGQGDDIVIMQRWLRQRDEPVPEVDTTGAMGQDHASHVQMPGLLTAEQMRQLAQASGTEFDRLFLTLMIEHHRGAVAMTEELMATGGAAQEEVVFRVASEVFAEQTTEINRMQQMIDALPSPQSRMDS